MDAVIQGKGFDPTLNKKQKRVSAYACIIISFLVWLGYSTPNTTDVFITFCKDIPVFEMNWPGIVFGIVLGFGLVSCGELLCMYLIVWKRWFILYLPLLIFAGASVFVTIEFQKKGNQINQIKRDKIGSVSDQIKDIENILTDLRLRRDEYKKQADRQSNEVLIGKRRQVQPYLHARWRQIDEQITEGTNKLSILRNQKIEKQNEIGVIIQPSESVNANTMQILIAIIAEASILFFGIIGIGLFSSTIQDKQYEIDTEKINNETKKKSKFVVNGTGMLKKKVISETALKNKNNSNGTKKTGHANVDVRNLKQNSFPYSGPRFNKNTIQLCFEVWNNWNEFAEIGMKQSYGNGAKLISGLLPGNQKISKTSFFRIINDYRKKIENDN